MDNLLSVSGKENYIKFYTTIRKFPAGFDDQINDNSWNSKTAIF